MSSNHRRYTEDHEWVEIEGDVVSIGITQYAADELGEVVYLDLLEPDEEIDKSDEFGSVESVKTVSGLYSPVSGQIVEVNQNVVKKPELINESAPWLIKIKIKDTSELDNLMDEDAYQSHIGN